MSETDYKSLYEQTERSYRTLAEQLLDRDKAELKAAEEAERAKAKPAASPAMAQKVYSDLLEDESWVEACRTNAWTESGLRRLHGPSDGSWPPGVDREAYLRKLCGLNAEGTALLSDTPTEEPEPELRADTSLHKLLRERHRL